MVQGDPRWSEPTDLHVQRTRRRGGEMNSWRRQLLQHQVAAVAKSHGPQTEQSSPMVGHLDFDFFAGHCFDRQGPTSTPVDSCFNCEGPAWDLQVENRIARDGANSRAVDEDFVRSERIRISGTPNYSEHAGCTCRHWRSP